MNHELGPLQKFVEFLYSIGLPPMRILRGLIVLLMIGALIGAVWIFGFGDDKSSSRRDTDPDEPSVIDTKETTDRTSYEFELSADQQIDEMYYFDPNAVGYVIVAGEFQKQKETIEKLRQRNDLTDDNKLKLAQIELRNSRVMVERKLRGGIDATNAVVELENLAQSHLKGANEKLKDLASFSLAKTSILKLRYFPTEENANLASNSLQSNVASYLNTPARSRLLLNLLDEARKKNPEKGFINDCIFSFGKLLLTSKESSVVETGQRIGEESLFMDYEVSSLERRIRYRDKKALEDLDRALRALEANPNVELSSWTRLIRAYEAFISIGNNEGFVTGRNIVTELKNKLPDSDERKVKLTEMLDMQFKRAKMIGMPYAISGSSVRERKIAPSNSEYTMLIFCDRKVPSQKMMSELMSKGRESGGTYRPIVAFLDGFTDEDFDRMNSIPRWVYVASEDTAKKYIADFAIDNFPYLFLIDKKGNVVAGNLSIVQAQNRIAAIETRMRENENKPASTPSNQ